jgi:hypothetical protein
MSETNFLGSARVSRAGFGVAPKQSFILDGTRNQRGIRNEKSAMAKTPSPARETRARPDVLTCPR